MDYYKVMKLLYDVYLGPNSENIVNNNQFSYFFLNLKLKMNLFFFIDRISTKRINIL